MFEDWADGYGLSTTPSVLAAFMIELKQNGADIAALKHLATAYLRQHERDVHVPIRAALKYCSK